MNDLGTAFEQIARELASQYSIGYYSTNRKRDGKFRKVEVRARPLTSPAFWLSFGDYPPDSLRAKEQGAVGTRIDIARDGKVTSCSIISSSGFPRLDEQTCNIVRRRARYRPAQDANGEPIPSFSILRFRWQVWD